VETLFTHTIKVQFPNLHEQFRNVKALKIMASKIGEVLKREPTDLYMKRPAGLMITVETQDISKLVGLICIPSMAKRATPKDTTLQRIPYFSLPCRHFDHITRACTISTTPIWDGSTPTGKPQPRMRGWQRTLPTLPSTNPPIPLTAAGGGKGVGA
jgi:hypothetical protein